MKGALVLALLLALPLAAAQSADLHLIGLRVAPFPGLVEPLKSPIETQATVEVSCPTQTVQDAQVRVYVTRAPAWAHVVIAPAQFQVPAARCQAATVEERVTVVVTADDQAPAFQAEAIELEAVLDGAPTNQSARASVDLTAAYFGILDVQLGEAIRTAPPETDVPFTVRVESLGNARTRVTTAVVRAEGGLVVAPVEPFELGSRQAGDTDTWRDVRVVVRTPAAERFMNQVGVVDLHLVGASALNPGFAGDEASVSLLVTTKSASPTPAIGAGALLAVLLLGAALRRR